MNHQEEEHERNEEEVQSLLGIDDFTDLSSHELARKRTELAEIRSDFARSRTIQAAERTYAAWIRTGFSMAGVGWSLAKALDNTESRSWSLLLGGVLIALGILCFIYAWKGFMEVSNYVNQKLTKEEEDDFVSQSKLVFVSLQAFTLILVFLLGFYFLLF